MKTVYLHGRILQERSIRHGRPFRTLNRCGSVSYTHLISVDDIRTQVNNDIVIKPYSSKYKIYIIPEADLMSAQAQNALLKTIEEPPEYAVIMLLTENAEALPVSYTHLDVYKRQSYAWT